MTGGDTSLLRIATAGSVDDGKSTLIGRILLDADQMPSDQLADLDGDLDRLAHLTDGLRAEREQGITIDVAHRYFSAGGRRFVLADSPGHREYTRNMFTAASTAEAAIVLVDVRAGLVEQTRRHVAIAGLLRVPTLVPSVNKMDLVDWDQEAFEEVVAAVREFGDEFGIERVEPIPISAREGDNVVNRSQRMNWYDGPPLLELLEALPPAPADEGPLRLPVQRVLKGGEVVGQLARGTIRPGDEVVVQPSGERTRVDAVALGERVLTEAHAPRSVTVTLAHSGSVVRGDTIASAEEPAEVAQALEATLCWLDETALHVPRSLLARVGTRTVRAQAAELVSGLQLTDARRVPAPDELALNDLGDVVLELEEDLVVDRYIDCRWTGSLILIDPDTHATVAGGTVLQTR